MLENPYQYALQLHKEDGTPVGSAAVTVDWEPAREWTRFLAVRRGELPMSGTASSGSIEPIWHREHGEPYVGGFRLNVRNGGAGASAEFTTAYFRRLARLASAKLVEKGKLASGDLYYFLALAFASRPESAQADAPAARFTAEEVGPALPLDDCALQDYLARAEPAGTPEPEDMPVFIAAQVIEETAQLTRAAPGLETGGILIGHLHRDPSLPEIFVHITAQVPARQAESSATKLTFTPEVWNAVNAAVSLRGKKELYLGYWHSHPVREWCKDCPEERQRNCRLTRDFFSEDDQLLLRTVFPRAYSVGLVSNDVAFGGLTFSLFGWRRGLIEPRGYYILGGNDA